VFLKTKEYFIAYKEGFLDESEKKNVESFISKNPSVKNDFSQYDNVFLQNEKIEFSDKSTLKRHGIQRFQWHAYSAVASVALLIVMFFTINNNIDLSTNDVLAYKQTQFSSSLQSKNISQLNQSNLEENELENQNSTTAIISNNNDNREENLAKMNDIEVSELPMAEMLVEYPQPILEHKYTDLYNNILIRQARRMQNQKNQSEIRFASNEESETLSKNKDPISLLDLIMPKKIFGISIESIEMATNAD
jgi:hypothetical protein